MVAYRRPADRGNRLIDGFDCTWSRRAQSMVAPSRDSDICVDNRICVHVGALNVLRHTIMWRAIVNASLFGCASAWYFYFKPNVLSIFENSERDRCDHGTIFSLFPIALLKPECEMQSLEEINDKTHAVFHFRIPACGQAGAGQ
jgi:hypothetical protein